MKETMEHSFRYHFGVSILLVFSIVVLSNQICIRSMEREMRALTVVRVQGAMTPELQMMSAPSHIPVHWGFSRVLGSLMIVTVPCRADVLEPLKVYVGFTNSLILLWGIIGNRA